MTVKVTDSVYGSQHTSVFSQVTYSYVATPDLDGVSTDVVLTVVIPGDGTGTFPTKSRVSSAADENSHNYFVSPPEQTSTAGTPIVHLFKLPVR